MTSRAGGIDAERLDCSAEKVDGDDDDDALRAMRSGERRRIISSHGAYAGFWHPGGERRACFRVASLSVGKRIKFAFAFGHRMVVVKIQLLIFLWNILCLLSRLI